MKLVLCLLRMRLLRLLRMLRLLWWCHGSLDELHEHLLLLHHLPLLLHHHLHEHTGLLRLLLLMVLLWCPGVLLILELRVRWVRQLRRLL